MAAKIALPSRVYQLMIKTAEPMVPKKLLPLWNHPAGYKVFPLPPNLLNLTTIYARLHVQCFMLY